MNSIGGFLGLELKSKGKCYHKDVIFLTTGRSCLNLILKNIKIKKIYIPFFTCDSVISPICENGIEYEFYNIDEKLELKNRIALQKDEYILYINYFGLKREYTRALVDYYGDKIIIDNTHAFFEKKIKGINSFNSIRKFFGVPDGACLYNNFEIEHSFLPNKEISIEHLINKSIGNNNLAFNQFLVYEKNISNRIAGISNFSRVFLNSIDYTNTKIKRIENFKKYEMILGGINTFKFSPCGSQVPLCYPFVPDKIVEKRLLHIDNIYIPTYWPELFTRNAIGFELEKSFSNRLLPLPIDQRYGENEVEIVSNKILEILC